jgi:hypothetical protein
MMADVLVMWLRDHRKAWAVGAGLWVVIAAAAVPYALWRGRPVWPQVVTLDEWVVAIGLLMWVFRSFIPAPETVNIAERHKVVGLLWWMKELTWALGFVFVLDLLTRAVLGLGLKAF